MHHKVDLYGTVTVGSKGQIVIPAEARETIGIKPGDKLFVVSLKDKKMIGICPMSSLETIVSRLSSHLKTLKATLDGEKV